MPTRLFGPLPRLTLVIGLLMLTLALAGVLAWHAHQAARSHETVARKVQRDYVEFAGWEFSRAAGQELTTRLDRWLDVIACAAASDRFPEPDALAGPGCSCDDLHARTLFQLDVETGDMRVTGQPLGPEALKWIRGTMSGERRIPASRHGRLVSIGTTDGVPLVMAVAYARDRFDVPVKIAGFAADPMTLAPVFTNILDRTPLLPPTLAGDRNDLVRVSVRAKDGTPVFLADAPPDWVRAESALDAAFDHLKYQVALSPEHAGQLVIGGLPRSRVPQLLGLLALTAILLAVATQQLRREHDLARMRGDFVASVSHELRTPLAQIRLFSETLLLGRVRSQDEARRSLEIIQQESRRLTHLVENVLYFSKSERGVQRVALAPTDISELASELVEAFAPIAHSGRTTIRLDVRSDVHVPADGGALRQILLNLLDNAVKYGRADQIVTVGIDRLDDRALITVDDQGPGVPLEARLRIWQPYSRLTSTASAAIAGTGIGLAVVRELVALHGGAVRVEDAPSGGARFVVELPGATAAAREADVPLTDRTSVPV